MPPKPTRRVEEDEDIIDSGSDTESESEEDEDTVRKYYELTLSVPAQFLVMNVCREEFNDKCQLLFSLSLGFNGESEQTSLHYQLVLA